MTPPHETASARAGPSDWITADAPSAAAIARRVLHLPATLIAQRALIATFVARELQARLNGTLLGRLWPILQPLALFLAYWLLFTRVLGVRLPSGAGSDAALAAYMFVGCLAWSGIAEALTRGAQSITEHAELVKKVSFPGAILPFKCVLVAAATQLFGVLAFVLARLAFSGDASALAHLAGLPLVLAAQIALVFGLALAVAASQVLLRDTAHVLALVLTLAMLATPVFWIADPALLPQLAPYTAWIDANPFQHLLVGWRWALDVELGPANVPRSFAVLGAWSLGALACGAALFALAERRFADEV